MNRLVDTMIAYRIMRTLTTPFEELPAYKLGIIDKDGNVLKKFATLTTKDEQDAYTVVDRLLFKIKRMLQKLPKENRNFATWTAALALIREGKDDIHDFDFLAKLEEVTDDDIQEFEQLLEARKTFKNFLDEEGIVAATPIANNTANVAMPDPKPLLKKKVIKRKD